MWPLSSREGGGEGKTLLFFCGFPRLNWEKIVATADQICENDWKGLQLRSGSGLGQYSDIAVVAGPKKWFAVG